MKRNVLQLSSNGFILLLIAFFFLSNTGHSRFVTIEWAAEVYPCEHCGLSTTSDLSDAVATVIQLVKNNVIASSLTKSCRNIKVSSPVSPSGYYTVRNVSRGSVVVYYNMD